MSLFPADAGGRDAIGRPAGGAAEPPRRQFRAMLVGMVLFGAGLCLYLACVLLAAIRLLIPGADWKPLLQLMLWYSGMPIVLGIALTLFELLVLLPRKRDMRGVGWDPPANRKVTVALTAYNDQPSIAAAVRDFLSHPLVERVIVVDNNSTDGTREAAAQAGAIVVRELLQGYGHCVYRALEEGLSYKDTELTVLCEGDMTFRAYDLDKLLAFVPHAEIVNGTRIVEQLRERRTQLTTFMYYGNFFAGKLLEVKHIGRGTLTDVGTTYKLCRNSVIRRLLPLLDPRVNLEFNAHFLDCALGHGFHIVECPVTFHNRVGVSKGGNVSNLRALKVGARMLAGMLLGWSLVAGKK